MSDNLRKKLAEDELRKLIEIRDNPLYESIKKHNRQLTIKINQLKLLIKAKDRELGELQINYNSEIESLSKTNNNIFEVSNEFILNLRKANEECLKAKDIELIKLHQKYNLEIESLINNNNKISAVSNEFILNLKESNLECLRTMEQLKNENQLLKSRITSLVLRKE